MVSHHLEAILMSDDIYVRKDVNEAQNDLLVTAIADTDKRIDDLRSEMNERINDIHNSINHALTIAGIVFAAVQIGLAVILFFLTKGN